MPYVIAGTLQEAPLSKAAQEELRRAGKDAETGKARSNKHVASLGPAFLLDDESMATCLHAKLCCEALGMRSVASTPRIHMAR